MHDAYIGRSERTVGTETARRALALAGCACAVAFALACAGKGGGRPASLVTADSCTLGKVTEQKLALEDGRAVYVEPSTIAGTARRFLLAGIPSVVWSTAADGTVDVQSQDSIIGVIVEGTRVATVLPPAGYRNVGDLRAVELGGGRWGIGFMTFAAPLDPSKDNKATGVWFGIYDGATWSTIERVPVPDSLVPMHNLSTRIVQLEDTLAWGLETQGPARQRAVLAKRTSGGTWRAEVLPAPLPAMLDIAPSTRGILVAVVEPDTIRADENSLFLYIPARGTWRRRLLVRGGDSANFEPRVLPGRDGDITVSSWKYAPNGRRSTRLWRALSPDDSGRVAPLADSTYEIVSPGDRWPIPLWIVSRQDPTGRPSELRLIVTGRDRVTVAGSIRNPYTGFFTANLDDGFNLVIAGPLQGTPPGEPIVVTQFLWAHLACDHAPR